MLTKILSGTVVGLSGLPINIEVDVSSGWPQFIMVGLADKAIDESRQRIPASLRNSGFDFPSSKRIVVNLAPADLKKEGAAFDLPIAVGILSACEVLTSPAPDALFVGELALDGSLRAVRGILPLALWAAEAGLKKIFLPKANAAEAGVVQNLEIIPVETLLQLVSHLTSKEIIKPFQADPAALLNKDKEHSSDMAFVSGQDNAKRALEIAAAGGHNVLMSGPPGSGKTLLSQSLPSILPAMSLLECIEVTKVYSVAGLLSPDTPLVTRRPFRSPHHTASGIALVGGGAYPAPGEISLSHRGVLFLDEFPEFSRSVLENLRQPLEDGFVTIARAAGSLTFPSRFILVAAQNPCPCGFAGDAEKECICSPGSISKYHNKISGPILDRIDLCVEVPRLSYAKLSSEERAESSASIRSRVEAARRRQEQRLKEYKIFTNGEMNAQIVKKICRLDWDSQNLLKQAVDSMHLSARSFQRLLKIARTIADLFGEEEISRDHLAEALQYRPKVS